MSVSPEKTGSGASDFVTIRSGSSGVAVGVAVLVAVLLTTRFVDVVRRPVIVIVATALGPMPKAPKSQSSMPPMTPPVSEQRPRVVVKPVYWKLAFGSSMRRTDATGAEPMFLAWIV